MSNKNIVVIDDDIFRLNGVTTYLTNTLEYDVRTANDARTGWLLITTSPPEVVIIDITLPTNTNSQSATHNRDPHGIALAKEIKEMFPSMGLILISTAPRLFDAQVQLLRHRYGESIVVVETTNSLEKLSNALERLEDLAMPTPPYLNEQERHRLASHLWALLGEAERPWIESTLTKMDTLSTREWQIISLLGQSLSATGIAEKLDITRSSVDNAISRIYAKLGLSALRKEAPELRVMLILIKANTLYTLRRTNGNLK